jgi:hypothetical protein
MQRDIAFFFQQKHVKLPAGELPRNGAADDTPANHKHIGAVAFQAIILDGRHAGGRAGLPCELHVINHAAGPLKALRRDESRRDDFLPVAAFALKGQMPALGPHGITRTEALGQILVDFVNMPHRLPPVPLYSKIHYT